MSDSSEVRFKWCGLSSDLRFKWFWLSIDLRFKWFGCQSMGASNDFGYLMLSVVLNFKWCGCQLIWDPSDSVVNWSEIQRIWLSIDLRFKWVGRQLIWDSNDLDVKWFEVQVIWLPTDVWFKWFCQTKLFCEIPFKIEALKLQNEAFLRDFLQNWSFEAPKRSFSARLPSKMKLWRSKTKHFCETSFKIEAWKLKNEAFLRDFLQKWIFEDQKRSISARLPSKLTCWANTWPQNSNTFSQFFSGCFKSTAPATKKLSRGIRSPVTATRNDPCKVTLPWHEICNPPTDSASDASNIDITKHEILAPATRKASFRSLFKSTTPANVFATLTNSCACHVFCNVSKSLRLPRETHFQPQKTSRDRQFLTILTSKSLSRAGVVQILRSSTSKSAPNPSSFNDFDFQIALARRRGANFVDVNFQKCSEHASF